MVLVYPVSCASVAEVDRLGMAELGRTGTLEPWTIFVAVTVTVTVKQGALVENLLAELMKSVTDTHELLSKEERQKAYSEEAPVIGDIELAPMTLVPEMLTGEEVQLVTPYCWAAVCVATGTEVVRTLEMLAENPEVAGLTEASRAKLFFS